MKKDRNSFFQSSNFNMSASANAPMMANPMPYGMNMMGTMPNMNASGANYYQANNGPMSYGMYETNDFSYPELESRLAKIERAINRLNARIDKLESQTFYSKDTYESDGNMYIV